MRTVSKLWNHDSTAGVRGSWIDGENETSGVLTIGEKTEPSCYFPEEDTVLDSERPRTNKSEDVNQPVLSGRDNGAFCRRPEEVRAAKQWRLQ